MTHMPKYLSVSKKKKKVWMFAIVGAVLVAAVAGCIALLLYSKGNDSPESAENEVLASETELPGAIPETEPCVNLETAYVSIQIPAKYADDLGYRAVSDGDMSMDIFSIKSENAEMELFRVYYGDGETGTFIGNLEVNEKKIPVTVSVSEYSDDAFEDEEKELYFGLMETLNTIVDAIRKDSRFVNNETTDAEKSDRQLTYWNVSLPADIQWEETTAGGYYQVSFFYTANSEKYMLYSFALGNSPLKNTLGMFSLDGTKTVVSMESYDLPDTESWPEDDAMKLYKMMETINDVIQAITEDERFSYE